MWSSSTFGKVKDKWPVVLLKMLFSASNQTVFLKKWQWICAFVLHQKTETTSKVMNKLKTSIFIKSELHHNCFPGSFTKLSGKPFLRLLLGGFFLLILNAIFFANFENLYRGAFKTQYIFAKKLYRRCSTGF